jgi:hypothetical protein
VSIAALDHMITGFEDWWLDRSMACRWFAGCILAAVVLGVAGGLLG